MKCEHPFYRRFKTVDGEVCRDCATEFIDNPKEPEGKPENVLGPSACCDRDPCKCGKEKYKSFMCRTGEHGQCVKCPCDCHGEKVRTGKDAVTDTPQPPNEERKSMTPEMKKYFAELMDDLERAIEVDKALKNLRKAASDLL